MGRVIPVTAEEVERVDALYRSGSSILQIASIVGRAQKTVQKMLREAGTPMRPGGRRPGQRPSNMPVGPRPRRHSPEPIETPHMLGAKCVGQWALFDSTEREDHAEARALCLQCPVALACQQLVHQLARTPGRHPVGTWAGALYGQRPYARKGAA